MRKKSWTWCCLGMCTVASLMSLEARGEAQDSAQRTDEIYEYARPAVVHIFSGWAGSLTYRGQKLEDQYVLSGTGMIISQDGYILTNAHVVEPTHEGDAIGRRTLYAQMVAKLARQSGLPAASVNEELTKQRVEVQLQRINLVYFSDDRSLPFEIKSYGTPTGRGTDLTTGKDVAVLKIEIRNAPTLPLGASANPKVGQEVWILGFPGAATSTEIPSNHEVTTELGRITSIAKRTQDGVPIIQTSANVGHGNSGGPVLNARGEVIGLMTFLADVENGPESSKFSFVVPVDTANEFVRQAGVSLGRGPVDALWREALSHFWAQRYTRAKDNLEQILNLNPHHAAAKEHLQRAQEEISAGHDERGLDDWLIYLLAGLLVASAVVAAVVWRKRAGPRASRPALP
ncbi:MAG: serine protease, partial [Polyangiales bacterium]